MFEHMYFEKIQKIDNKGRLFLPAESNPVVGSEVAIAKMEYYYQVFLLTRINKLVEDLELRCMEPINPELKKRFINELNFVFNAIKRTSKVDSQHRIMFVPLFDDKSAHDLILQGRNGSIAVFPGQDEYEEYQKTIEPSSILRGLQ